MYLLVIDITNRGWEVANDTGSSVVSLSKQISDDEDVFVSFKADMQSDISVPEDVVPYLLFDG